MTPKRIFMHEAIFGSPKNTLQNKLNNNLARSIMLAEVSCSLALPKGPLPYQ